MQRRTFLKSLAAVVSAGTGSLAGVARPAFGASRARVSITIAGIAFAEVTQTLRVGDTVEWINKDVMPHTATAKNKEWRVVIPANETAALVLKKTGTVDYYCEYHPNMTGRLVIKAK